MDREKLVSSVFRWKYETKICFWFSSLNILLMFYEINFLLLSLTVGWKYELGVESVQTREYCIGQYLPICLSSDSPHTGREVQRGQWGSHQVRTRDHLFRRCSDFFFLLWNYFILNTDIVKVMSLWEPKRSQNDSSRQRKIFY